MRLLIDKMIAPRYVLFCCVVFFNLFNSTITMPLYLFFTLHGMRYQAMKPSLVNAIWHLSDKRGHLLLENFLNSIIFHQMLARYFPKSLMTTPLAFSLIISLVQWSTSFWGLDVIVAISPKNWWWCCFQNSLAAKNAGWWKASLFNPWRVYTCRVCTTM